MKWVKTVTYFFYLLLKAIETEMEPWPLWRKITFMSCVYLASIFCMLASIWLNILIMVFAAHIVVYNFTKSEQVAILRDQIRIMLGDTQDGNGNHSH